MKIKTSEATNIQLNWMVAKAQGATNFSYDTVATYWITLHGEDRALSEGWAQSFCPSTDWAQGGPIIERGKLTVAPRDQKSYVGQEAWTAYRIETLFTDQGDREYQTGSTPLIAAMRCYVASKMGDEVEIPEELS